MPRGLFLPAYQDFLLNLPGLVGYWPLGETSGTRCADLSRNYNHGTYTASPKLGADGPPSRDPRTAVRFTAASSQYVTIPDSSAYSLPTTGQLTVMSWVKPTTDAANATMVAKRNAATACEWQLDRQTTNVFRFFLAAVNGSTRATVASAAILAATGWHMVGATVNESTTTLILYVDGVSVASTATFAGVSTDTAQPVTIGQRGDGVIYQNGTQQNVLISGIALPPATMLDAYRAAF